MDLIYEYYYEWPTVHNDWEIVKQDFVELAVFIKDDIYFIYENGKEFQAAKDEVLPWLETWLPDDEIKKLKEVLHERNKL